MKITIICISLFVIQNSFSQSILKVGDIAPKIEITDYIANVPKDKNLENKYILLEFWATWCGACLDNVPKLNLLENKFKTRKDLIFISITDEKPEKAIRTLNRIPFSSMVVCDRSLKTRKNFIEQKNGSFSIPQTFLIDKKGIIKWIGTPDLLNENLISKFINNNVLNEIDNSENKLPPAPIFVENPKERLCDIIFNGINNENTKYSFSIIKGNKEDYKIDNNSLENEGLYFNLNNDLTSIISSLKNILSEQVIVSENLKDELYSVFYKNSIFKTKFEEDIKENILKSLNLTENINYIEKDVWVIKCEDIKKMVEIKNDFENHNGMNNSHFLMSNIKTETLALTFSKKFSSLFLDETKLTGNYDFIIRNDTFENMRSDLKFYGLLLVKEKKQIPIYNYQK